MNDKPRIIAGLVVFIALALFPVWYGLGGMASGYPTDKDDLELDLPDRADQVLFATDADYHCIEDLEFMRANHMDTLNNWRNAVVRDGQKLYTSQAYGVPYEMSLTHTCMRCHKSRQAFCAKCHEYAGVKSFGRLDPSMAPPPGQAEPQEEYGVMCWNCHLQKRGN